MCHSEKTAATNYRKFTANSVAANGLKAIKKANKKQVIKQKRLKAAIAAVSDVS